MNLTTNEIDLLAERVAAKIAGTTPKRWFTLAEACEYISVSRNTMIKWIKAGHVYGSKATGEWRIDRESIDDFLNMGRF
jgi:excisionase family DNA binding protein